MIFEDHVQVNPLAPTPVISEERYKMLYLLKPMDPPMKRRAGLWIVQAGRGSYRGSHSSKAFAPILHGIMQCSGNSRIHMKCKVLVWEDGFCNIPNPRSPMVSRIDNFHFEDSNKIFLPTLNSCGQTGAPYEYPVGLAIAEMSTSSHVVGEGVVGHVALTGTPHWIYLEHIAADMFTSSSFSQYPEEWLLQFASGIKTILLFPVTPHGVLQLGSVEMVAEDAALFSYVKNGLLCSDKSDGHDWRYLVLQLSVMFTFLEGLEESATFTPINAIEDPTALIAENQLMTGYFVQEFCNTTPGQGALTLGNGAVSEFSQQALGMFDVAEPWQLSSEDYKSLVTGDDILNYFHREEILRDSPYCEDLEGRIQSDFVHELKDFNFEEGATDQSFVGGFFDSSICETRSNVFGFAGDYEVQRALGTATEDNGYLFNFSTSIQDHEVAFRSIGDRVTSYSIDAPTVVSIGFPTNDAEMEHLLEAGVANTSSSLDDSSSSKSCVTSFCAPEGKDLASPNRRHNSPCIVSADDSWNFSTSEFTAYGLNSPSRLSPSIFSVERKNGMLSDVPEWKKGHHSLSTRKVSRLPKSKKRKNFTGDSLRSRPRDRQLIQDRIKELRELVPNTEKCSIDGLLDKTVKHMLFLRSVTDQADKLRKHEANDTKTRATEIKNSHKNGSSWAVELESDLQMCPIVVKDLDQPGHMLIEMLCADHGRFLDIADAIHRLKLTILNGEMDKSSADNSWARFIVETSGSFHRLDIFWPLMQLLQQNQSSI